MRNYRAGLMRVPHDAAAHLRVKFNILCLKSVEVAASEPVRPAK